VSPNDREIEDPEGFESLLEYLRRGRGFDFSGYKRASLERRVRKRMDAVGVGDYQDYQDLLEVTPEEFTELFNTILINVTGFFRDKPAWDHLEEAIVPKVLDGVPAPESIRVWSAGCASGEEAYTIAMVLAEAMGEDEFRRRVKIYATDVDEDALTQARHAAFPRDRLNAVPRELVERYFEVGPLGQTFRTDMRRSVIFGRNDLVQDAPISRIDLLVCRNTLMYFTPETQARILGHFNFALNERGFLFLGKSEMLITHTDLFTPEELKWRVFTKVPRRGLRERLAFVSDGIAPLEHTERQSELRSAAADIAPSAQVVVDRGGFVVSLSQNARTLFGVGQAEVGRPLQDLELSYRPVDLRSAIGRAYEERMPVDVGRVERSGSDGEQTLQVRVTPLLGAGDALLGAVASFEDVTAYDELDKEHQRSKRELETAYEELQSTVEELETTNEELHSTNEELETTNEELQSTNEELETMNEELQSTNDELEAMNDEQQSRTVELDRVNLFLEGILGSLGIGVVVLDREMNVQVWNALSTELWGLRPEEAVGEPFLELDIGLPVQSLAHTVRRTLGSDGERSDVTLEAVSRRGRSFRCWVRAMPLLTATGDKYGVILLMADRADGEPLAAS